MSTKLVYDGRSRVRDVYSLDDIDQGELIHIRRHGLARPTVQLKAIPAKPQLPFAYGLTDDPESRSLNAVEGEE